MAKATISLEPFKQQIIALGLVPDDVLNQHTPSEVKDAEALSRLLVKRQLLTSYQAQQLLAGKGKSLVLGNYVILDKLGQGGMGMVLKARHRRMDRIVAIKILSANVTKNVNAAKRFQREVKAAARLEHPNIVSALDADEVNGTPFLVMQFVEGTDLSALVKKNGPLPVDQAVSCVLQAANGLKYAHEQGVIHRDIKPANLFLDRSGTVKVLDMGLARLESEGANQDELTGTGQIMGTIDYMAPEQAADTKNADVRADVYSLGVTLWYLLTGSALYPAGSTVMKLMAHQNQPIPSLCEACPAVTQALEIVFRRMVAKLPDERFQSMSEVITALEQCRSGQSSAPAVAMDNADVSLATFLRGMESSPSLQAGAKTAVAKKAARKKDQRTAMLLAADVETDSQSQLSLPPRQRAGKAKSSSKQATLTSKRMWIATSSVVASLFIIAAVVFFVRTKYGVIRVEITDPDIEVQIKGTDIVLKAADQGKDVRLTAGEQSLVIQRDDFTFETDRLILKKDEVTTVRVELVAGEIVVRDGETVLGHAPLPEVTSPVVTTNTTALTPARTGVAEWNGWSKDTPAPAIVPFDSVEARQHQEAWAAYLKLPVEYTNSIGMRFRLIPPGEFVMGSTAKEIEDAVQVPRTDQLLRSYIESEAPQHTVVLTQPVYIGVHEVTEGQYEKVTGVNPVRSAANMAVAPADAANHPVVKVTWHDAYGFTYKLSNLEGLAETTSFSGATGFIHRAGSYRLTTEAEWEFSCRAGTTTRYWNGDNDIVLTSTAWTNSNAGNRTHVVGELNSNPFGLFDQTGNVWEWVADHWVPTAYQERKGKLTIDPLVVHPPTTNKSVRGGAFTYYNANCRSSHRFANHSQGSYGNCGFRVAIEPETVRALIQSAAKAASQGVPDMVANSDAAVPASAVAPFDAQMARSYQEAWAKHLGVPVDHTNALGMKFRLVPPGEFMMGTPDNESGRHDNESPLHRVRLTQPYYLGETEVTQSQWFAVMGTRPWLGGQFVIEGDDNPAAFVTWNDCSEYCRKLSSADGATYRLPTEAEWEYACRAGSSTVYSFGSDVSRLSEFAWFVDNAGNTSEKYAHFVGTKEPNPFGLRDMHGNLFELCQDRFDLYIAEAIPVVDPVNTADGGHRVTRGGSWDVSAIDLRSGRRGGAKPDFKSERDGFRVVRTIKTAENGDNRIEN